MAWGSSSGEHFLASNPVSVGGVDISKGGFVFNVLAYGAKGDGKTDANGAITNGLTAFTIGGTSLTQADVGKAIVIAGAGAAGASLKTTIATVTDGSHGTTALAAGGTVAAAKVIWGTLDTAAGVAALADMPAAGGVFFVPAGRACLMENLPVSNKSHVRVSGGGQILWVGIDGTAGFQLIGTVSDFTIELTIFSGTGIAADAQQCLFAGSGQTLADIKVINNEGTDLTIGFSLNQDTSGSITGLLYQGNYLDNIVGSASGQGYGLHNANQAGSTNGRVIGNLISRAHRHGIYQARGSGVVIQANCVRLHRTGDAAGGSELPCISVGRSFDIVVESNYFDRPNDCSIDVFSTAGTTTRTITIRGNIFSNPVSTSTFYQIIIGSTNPAVDGAVEEILIEANQCWQNGNNVPCLQIYSGLRVQVIGNTFAMLGVTSTTFCIQIRGLGEGAGTATYTDRLTFRNNQLYGTQAGGALYGWGWHTLASTSGITAKFTNNDVNVPQNAFFFSAAQTNPNISCFDSPTTGLDLTLLASIVAGSLAMASDLKRSFQTVALNGGTVTINPKSGELVLATLSATTTIALGGEAEGQEMTIEITHDGTATAYTLTWPANVKLAGGAFGTNKAGTNTANAKDTLTLIRDATNFVEKGRALAVA